MWDDIAGFENMIAGYKSIIGITVGDTNFFFLVHMELLRICLTISHERKMINLSPHDLAQVIAKQIKLFTPNPHYVQIYHIKVHFSFRRFPEANFSTPKSTSRSVATPTE
jgi:hypothetical protein